MSPTHDGRLTFRLRHPPRRVDLGGTRWEYFAAGRGRTGLVVLGGELAFGDTPHRIISRFEETHRVISPSYPHVASIPQVLDGVAQLMDVEGIARADVFGHGLGAGFAHLLARRHPTRIDRVALSGFGLATPFRAGAARARVDVLRHLPEGAVRQHFERIFQRHADSAGDIGRGGDVLELARELLDRHSRESLLKRLELLSDLSRGEDGLNLSHHVQNRALLLLATDDPSFTRQEQDNLARTYPAAMVVRHPSAGRLLGLGPAPELEKKLELFFRIDPAAIAPRPQAPPAAVTPAPTLRPGTTRARPVDSRVDWVEG